MNLRLRTRRKTIYVAISAILIYWVLLKKRRYTETLELILDSVEPKVAWEYIADFSNLMKLNPTIQNFEIEYEKGNYALWEYAVTYKEHLVNFPFIHNDNHAVYKVTPESHHGRNEPFRIDSEHSCCMYYLCLKTNAEMTFTAGPDTQSTKIVETIHFECPTILTPICRREIRSQKKLIYAKIVDANMAAF